MWAPGPPRSVRCVRGVALVACWGVWIRPEGSAYYRRRTPWHGLEGGGEGASECQSVPFHVPSTAPRLPANRFITARPTTAAPTASNGVCRRSAHNPPVCLPLRPAVRWVVPPTASHRRCRHKRHASHHTPLAIVVCMALFVLRQRACLCASRAPFHSPTTCPSRGMQRSHTTNLILFAVASSPPVQQGAWDGGGILVGAASHCKFIFVEHPVAASEGHRASRWDHGAVQ